MSNRQLTYEYNDEITRKSNVTIKKDKSSDSDKI